MSEAKTRDYIAKADQGKADWSLIPWRSVEKMVEIMTQAIMPKDQGGKGYGTDSWKTVPGGYYRYFAALIRHAVRRFVYGEILDPESGLPHMAHILCNAAFICEKDMDEEKDENFFTRDI